MASFFHTTIFEPIYNGLVFLIDITPFADVGVAVIILTCVIKFLLFPLSKKAVKTQMAMKAIEPETAKIKKQFKNNKEELARQTLSLYKKHNVKTFSSFAEFLIHIPIIFGLWIFPKKVFCWLFWPAFPNSFKQNWQCRRLNRVATSPASRPIWRGVWAYKCVMFFPLWWSLSLTAFLALLLYIGQQVISLPSLKN